MRILVTITAIFFGSTLFAQSILSSGNWHKIGITEEGVYKLSFTYLTNKLGLDSKVDPKTIKLYGIAGGMLPQPNHISRPNDPVEIPIFEVGESDGKLDASDYFLFYAEGPGKFFIDSLNDPVFDKNLYCDTAYYFITYGGAAGKRISEIASGDTGEPTNKYLHYIIHEEDMVNTQKSGRFWLGEEFGRNVNRIWNFEHPLSGKSDSLHLWMAVGANSVAECSMDVSINDQSLGRISIDSIPEDIYNEKLKYSKGYFKLPFDHSSAKLTINFNPATRTASTGATTSVGYLDRYIMAIAKDISVADYHSMVLKYHSDHARQIDISNKTSMTQVWDITDVLNPKIINENTSNKIISHIGSNSFVVLDGSDFPEPENFGKLQNQNIKSLVNSHGLIITSPKFLTDAKRLADFHSSETGISIGVTTPRQIYNEFSGGRQDVTAIRDFIRYCYQSGGNLEHVILFGDASFDYKNRILGNTNLVPIYQSRESAHNLYTYSSDDYYTFMEENEGEWFEGVRKPNSDSYPQKPINHTMDIGIGRLPAKTENEARIIVDKIIRYKTAAQTYGKWRNKITYIADDGDNGFFMSNTEELYKIANNTAPQYEVEKLFLDMYDQTLKGNNVGIRQAINTAVKEGAFMLNYIGHGNDVQLADENIMDEILISDLSNRHKLPLFVTATCSFGKFDNPYNISGAERLLLNENGGAIALLTTTRFVLASSNLTLNKALHRNLFDRIDGIHPRLGDIIRHTKNQGQEQTGVTNRNFSLLGDPMLWLNYPEYDIIFDNITSTDTLSALEKYKLDGTITYFGEKVEEFEGIATIKVFDIPQEKITDGSLETKPFIYEEQTNAIFRGDVTVSNGSFSAEFVVPKNISYKYAPGKITVYAWNENDPMDATGATNNIVFGGTANQVATELTPPKISMYINESGFKNGDVVGASSLLIANISDESGINITNDGLVEGITLQINDQNPIDLNTYYTSKKDSYTSGTVLFPLQNYEPGSYSATIRVLDIHNNVSETRINFKVTDQPILRLFNVTNYPNPAKQYGETTFRFEHDRIDEKLEITILIYNMEGQIVSETSLDIDNSSRHIDNLTLPLSNSSGSPLEKGVYIYRLRVSSTLDHATNEAVNRLIIIN